MDTNTPGGKLVFHFFAALAEFERDIIQERTRAGLAAARARGRRGGRPKLEADSAKRKKKEHRKINMIRRGSRDAPPSRKHEKTDRLRAM